MPKSTVPAAATGLPQTSKKSAALEALQELEYSIGELSDASYATELAVEYLYEKQAPLSKMATTNPY
jgi:hypothetical protein